MHLAYAVTVVNGREEKKILRFDLNPFFWLIVRLSLQNLFCMTTISKENLSKTLIQIVYSFDLIIFKTKTEKKNKFIHSPRVFR